MREIETRLGELGRVEPSPRLDAKIGKMIAAAEGAAVWRQRRGIPVPVAVGLCCLCAVAGFALHMLVGAPGSGFHTPTPVIIELPPTPALERVLVQEPADHPPFFEQQFVTVETVFVAGSPAAPVPTNG